MTASGVPRPALPRACGVRLLTAGFLLLTTGAFLFQTALHFLVPLLPLYLTSLGSSLTVVGAIMGLGSFGALVVRLFSGRLVARYGRLAFLTSGAAVAALGAALLSLTATAAGVVPLRLLLTGAMALYMTAATTLAADLAPEERRGEAMGWFGTAAPLAMAVGPGAGGLLLARVGFGGAFLGSAAVATAAVLCAVLLGRRAEVGVAQAPSPGEARLLAGAAVTPALVMLGLVLANGAVFTFVPVRARELGLANVGTFFVLYALTMLLVRGYSGKVSDRLGRAAPMLPGSALVAGGLAVMGFTAGPAWLLGAGVLVGAGLGAVSPAMTAWVVDRVGPEQRAAGVATLLVAMDVGIGTGSVGVGVVIQAVGFQRAFQALAVLVLAVAVAFTGVWWREHGAIVVRPER